MLKNHLRLAWRNLIKHKGFSALNVFGLAIGITCCLLIFHYVAYERSYDAFQQNAGRIVRVRLDRYQQGKLAWKSATSPTPLSSTSSISASSRVTPPPHSTDPIRSSCPRKWPKNTSAPKTPSAKD